MPDEVVTKPKRARWRWILWWKIDAEELSEQVAGYGTLGLFKSARGISALCLMFSIIITIAFIIFKVAPIDSAIDAMVMLVLAIFIYFGHRWAMILAMVVWTIEKSMILVGGFTAVTPNGASFVPQIIWWCVYMHAFYLAFQVERRRRKFDPNKLAAVF